MRAVRTSLRSIGILLLLGLIQDDVLAQRRELGPAEYSAGGPCDSTAWKLVFHDEFDGNELDRSKWVTYFTYSHDGSDQCEGCRATGNSNAIYRDEQVSVGDGMLTLSVQARSGTWYGQDREHESGMVHSIGSAKFTYGRFEARCKIPNETGLWPAFWGFGGETEIDVFEFCGERTRLLKMALHRWGDEKFSSSSRHKGPDMSLGFHDYALEWDEDEIRWYFDGEMVHSRGRFVDRRGRPLPACGRSAGTHATAPYFPRATDGINVILNLSVSPPKNYCKGPRKQVPWPEGTALVVDHVRVYQREPQEHLSDLCAAPRRLLADGQEGALRAGASRRYHVSGPHGDLEWSTGTGLEIIDRDAHGITVRSTGEAEGLTWVRAESLNDPCPRGPLMLEIGVDLVR